MPVDKLVNVTDQSVNVIDPSANVIGELVNVIGRSANVADNAVTVTEHSHNVIARLVDVIDDVATDTDRSANDADGTVNIADKMAKDARHAATITHHTSSDTRTVGTIAYCPTYYGHKAVASTRQNTIVIRHWEAMVNRVIRYALLVFTLLLAFSWVWSYWRMSGGAVRIGNHQLGFTVNSGAVGTGIEVANALESRFQFWNWKADPSLRVALETQGGGYTFLGVVLLRNSSETGCWIPMWILFSISSAATAALWYRRIRDRLRGKHVVGFEVDAKTPPP